MATTTYQGNMLLDAFLRGVAPTLPAGLWVALHTADPTVTGAVNEVLVADWPAYVRKSALGGGTLLASFSAAAAKATLNTQQMLWPAFDGVGTITISHFSIWDSVVAGNALFYGALRLDPSDPVSALEPKILGALDEFILYPNKLGVMVA